MPYFGGFKTHLLADLFDRKIGLTRTERVGVYLFAVAIFGLAVLPRFFSTSPPAMPVRDSATLAMLDTLSAHKGNREEPRWAWEERTTKPWASSSNKSNWKDGERFAFDPNTLDEAGFVRMGLSPKQAAAILRYRSRGGFRKPEDFAKIFVLPEGFYDAVAPYIRMESVPNGNTYAQKDFPASSTPPPARYKPAVVDVNVSDTSSWIALPGIGGGWARRITNFRDKLGGFVSVDQVGETYGLPDSTFQKIKPQLRISGAVRKINVNTATKEQLDAHPYISRGEAGSMVEYRNQHGAYKSLEGLKNVMALDEGKLQKMLPYLTVGE